MEWARDDCSSVMLGSNDFTQDSTYSNSTRLSPTHPGQQMAANTWAQYISSSTSPSNFPGLKVKGCLRISTRSRPASTDSPWAANGCTLE
eukprot:scaffold60277_cov21-Tisochrysis_lutea.AAC.2